MRSLASSTLESLEKTVKIQEEKFTHFEVCTYVRDVPHTGFGTSLPVLKHFQESLSVSLSQTIKSANTNLKLKRADVLWHVVSAKELWRKVCSV